ncbi:MAG TPA: hypothetical protein VL400_10665, partial [Polyangiaceae bacterium]|nr:hypothetical protein [Polyangiaceae bacterium]
GAGGAGGGGGSAGGAGGAGGGDSGDSGADDGCGCKMESRPSDVPVGSLVFAAAAMLVGARRLRRRR